VASADIRRGGYVLADCPQPQVVLIATGSEVKLAVEASCALAAEGIAARVVSLPCAEVFERQDSSYRNAVLPRTLPRLAIEAGVSSYWRRYVGLDGAAIGIDRFGESAPAGRLFDFFGFTVAGVVDRVKSLL
jgi:transketolase